MEIWKPVKDYEGLYEVSNLGNVKSLNYRQTKKESLLKPGKNNAGYLQVILSKNKKTKPFSVHRLVASSFLGFNYKGHKIIVDHINNIKDDNRVENLQITTHRVNCFKDQKNTSSKYIGVTWNKKNKNWNSCIRINDKTKNLGSFKKEIDAAKAYQEKLKEIDYEEFKNQKLPY